MNNSGSASAKDTLSEQNQVNWTAGYNQAGISDGLHGGSLTVIRFRLLLMLFAWLLPLFAASQVQANDDDYQLLYTTPDKWLEVWSDHAIGKARCKSIADRVQKAYMFVSQQEAWRKQDLLFKPALRVRVVGSIKSKVLGFAQGPSLFVVQDDYLNDELSEGTLAHELTHIQDNRQLRGAKLPSFLLEGRALTNGHKYRLSRGQGDNKYDRAMATSAMRFTSEDAAEILDEFQDSGWDMQAMGTVLVEYMRTRWNGGVADIHPKLSRMIERMAEGVELENAFQQEFGASCESLLQSFMSYLDKTAAHPQTRLEYTIWHNTLPATAPSAEEDES